MLVSVVVAVTVCEADWVGVVVVVPDTEGVTDPVTVGVPLGDGVVVWLWVREGVHVAVGDAVGDGGMVCVRVGVRD